MSLGQSSRFKNIHIWWVSIFLIVVLLSFKSPVGQQLNLFFAPLVHAVKAPVRWSESLSLWFNESSRLQENYKNLQQTVAKQKLLKQELSTLRVENAQLRKFLNITQIKGYTWRVVGVVGRSLEKKSRRLTVELSKAHIDDVIISYDGLVGLVDTLDNNHAVVRTILDASVTVPVTMNSSNLAGLVRGDGSKLTVDFIPIEDAPKKGDILITSGAGGVFPAGIPVAAIEQVKPIEGGVFAIVTAKPIASWQRDAWLAAASKKSEVIGTSKP